jgi:hypothetical protein
MWHEWLRKGIFISPKNGVGSIVKLVDETLEAFPYLNLIAIQ